MAGVGRAADSNFNDMLFLKKKRNNGVANLNSKQSIFPQLQLTTILFQIRQK